MNPSQQIWLVRHGETAWSLTGQHTGRNDLPLLPEADTKLQMLRPHLKHPFALVLSSPLQRARQTAAILGFPSVETDDRLMEWDYGHYEGKTLAQIRQSAPRWSLWTDGCPGGETLQEVVGRVNSVIQRAQSVSGDVLLIAHGHLLRVLAACWLGGPPSYGEHLALSTSSACILTYDDIFPVLARWNWRPELRLSH
jgi:broad specificity phosphatase PhoE